MILVCNLVIQATATPLNAVLRKAACRYAEPHAGLSPATPTNALSHVTMALAAARHVQKM